MYLMVWGPTSTRKDVFVTGKTGINCLRYNILATNSNGTFRIFKNASKRLVEDDWDDLKIKTMYVCTMDADNSKGTDWFNLRHLKT